jgi:hypothetical protein
MLSSDSRWASDDGNATAAGCGAATVSSSCCSDEAPDTVSSVRPKYSDTAPVTRTWSPRCTRPAVADENTNTASDAVWAPRSIAPPVPAVWIV